jgi:cullin-5
VGRYDLDVTTFQMAVLFTWNERPNDKITFENLRLATELPDAELRRTLWVNQICYSILNLVNHNFSAFVAVFGRFSKIETSNIVM